MGISSIFLVLAVLVLVGLYLYMPFTTRERRTPAGESREASALKAERDRVINSLQELDFDHSLGKIPSEDYPGQRSALLQKGAEILRQLDQIAPAATSPRDAESRIERAAAAGRADSPAKIAKLADEDIESMIAARRKEHRSKSAGFCPKCGKPVLVSDKFCPSALN